MSGSYPNPGFAVDMATQGELNGVSTFALGVSDDLGFHAADTTGVHGITNTALLETQAGAQAKVDTAVSTLLGGAPSAALDTIKELGDLLTTEGDAVAALTSALATEASTARAAETANADAIATETTARGSAVTGAISTASSDATTKAAAAQAAAVQRANHTGTQAPSTITGTAVVTGDSRLSDARTPTAHATSHAAAGSDPVTLAQSQVTGLVSDLATKAPATRRGSGWHYIEGRTGSATAPTVNRSYVVPIFIGSAVTITGLTCWVTTGQAASTVRLGVYDDDGTDQRPLTRLLDAGTVATATNGVAGAITGLSLALQPGWYWLAYNATTLAPTVVSVDPSPHPLLPDQTNSATVLGAIFDSAGSAAGALPSSFTYSSTNVQRGAAPRLGFLI